MATLTVAEIEEHLKALPGWEAAQIGVKHAIQKSIKTGNFMAGLGLTTQIAVLAEKLHHHPNVLLTYPRVTIQLTTHSAGGVTEKDIDMAKAIDALQS